MRCCLEELVGAWKWLWLVMVQSVEGEGGEDRGSQCVVWGESESDTTVKRTQWSGDLVTGVTRNKSDIKPILSAAAVWPLCRILPRPLRTEDTLLCVEQYTGKLINQLMFDCPEPE